MTFEEENRVWTEAMKAKGHMPKLTEYGELDVFVTEFGYHHGPGCSACGWTCCMNCEKPADIPQCDCIEGTLTPPLIEAAK